MESAAAVVAVNAAAAVCRWLGVIVCAWRLAPNTQVISTGGARLQLRTKPEKDLMLFRPSDRILRLAATQRHVAIRRQRASHPFAYVHRVNGRSPREVRELGRTGVRVPHQAGSLDNSDDRRARRHVIGRHRESAANYVPNPCKLAILSIAFVDRDN